MQQVKTRPGKINKLQIDTNPHKLDARPRSRERRSPRTNPFVTARFGRDGLCPVRSHAARGDTRPPVRGVSGEGRASSRPSGDCRMSGVVGRVRGAYSRGERTRQSASLPLRPLWQKNTLERASCPFYYGADATKRVPPFAAFAFFVAKNTPERASCPFYYDADATKRVPPDHPLFSVVTCLHDSRMRPARGKRTICSLAFCRWYGDC